MLGACILSGEEDSPDKQLLSTDRAFCYMGLLLFLPHALACGTGNHIIKSQMIRREMTVSKATWYTTCTSRTVNQRPEGFVLQSVQ
jgi:hypothetical protein